MRTKRAYFRGTTSFRRALPQRRTRHPDSSTSMWKRPIGSRYNGLTRADLLYAYPYFFSAIPGDVRHWLLWGLPAAGHSFSISKLPVYSSQKKTSIRLFRSFYEQLYLEQECLSMRFF